jgi:hypothetical protein
MNQSDCTVNMTSCQTNFSLVDGSLLKYQIHDLSNDFKNIASYGTPMPLEESRASSWSCRGDYVIE